MSEWDGDIRGPVGERGPAGQSGVTTINNLDERIDELIEEQLPTYTLKWKLKHKYFPTFYKGIKNIKKGFSFWKLLLQALFNIGRLRLVFVYYKFFRYQYRLKFRWLIPFNFNKYGSIWNIDEHIIYHSNQIIFIQYEFSELPNEFKQLTIFNYFTPNVLNRYRQELLENGIIHRIDGPAMIKKSFIKEWIVNGQRHREDGPAIVSGNKNIKMWFINGQRHREDGPAWIEKEKNIKRYFLRDHEVTEKEIILNNFTLNINFE
jgi:hypothetical protein